MSHDPDGKPCPNPSCSSTDGYKIQDNGWGHCFVCGYNTPPRAEGKPIEQKAAPVKAPRPIIPILDGADVFIRLEDRGISRETAERYKVWRTPKGDHFPSFKDGHHVGTKRRALDAKSPDCKVPYTWSGQQGELFGQHLFPPGSSKFITVTEGEYDAMAAFEMFGSEWPFVSVLNGTGTAIRDLKDNFEYLNSFPTVVINFDNDEAGMKAAKQASGLPFPPGKLKIFRGKHHKDANDYLKAKEHGIYKKEWWKAPTFMPDGLKIGTSMWDEIINHKDPKSVPYPWGGLNRFTYGIRQSELVVITANTGVGKTSVLKEIEYSLLMNPELIEEKAGVGFLHFEEPNYDTVIGLMSVHDSKPYHLPDTHRTEDDLKKAYEAVIATDRVVIWDHFGSNSIDAVIDKVRHMAALGCKYIVVDHLSIIVSDQSGDERKQLDEIATKLKTICMEQELAVICVIHQNRQGTIRGTAGVEQLANIVMKLHRDHTDADEWRRNITKVVIEKNRFCGRAGPASWLWFNEDRNRLIELTPEEVEKYETGGTKKDDEYEF